MIIISLEFFTNPLGKKDCLVGSVRTKMQLCYNEITYAKVTKTLGNNKALA